MNDLQLTAIGKLAEVRSGAAAPQDPSAFSNSGHPFVRAGSLSRLLNGGDEDHLEKISPEVARVHRLQLFPGGTVLFAKSGMSATKGYIYKLKRPAYVVSHLAALVPRDARDSSFLTRALQQFSPAALIKDQAYPSIRLGDIEQMEILAPKSVEGRGRIAAILDTGDALRQKRKRALNLVEGLTAAAFQDRFLNERKEAAPDRFAPLGDLCHIIRDGVHKTPSYVESGVPFVTVKNITSGELDLRQTKFISESEHLELTKRVCPQPGDVLVSKDGTIGVPCLVPEGPIFSIFVSVALLRPRIELIDATFLAEQIRTDAVQQQIKESSKGIAIRHLHLGDFAKLRILVPPLKDQAAFVSDMLLIREHRDRIRRNLLQFEALFSSLQSRAFSGQL